MKNLLNKKRSQAEVITTVLLVLISIAAVVLVSGFVLNFVRNNLKSTDCLQAQGQLEIKEEISYFNNSAKSQMLYVTLERGIKVINVTGITLVFGNDKVTKKAQILSGASSSNIFYAISSNSWSNQSFQIPDSGEIKTYRINVTNYGVTDVNNVVAAFILEGGAECEKADEKTISIVA